MFRCHRVELLTLCAFHCTRHVQLFILECSLNPRADFSLRSLSVWPSPAYKEKSSRFVLLTSEKNKKQRVGSGEWVELGSLLNVGNLTLIVAHEVKDYSKKSLCKLSMTRKGFEIRKERARDKFSMVVDPSNHTHSRGDSFSSRHFCCVGCEVASSVLLLEQVIEWNKRWEEWLDNDGRVDFLLLLLSTSSPQLVLFSSVVCAMFSCIS